MGIIECGAGSKIDFRRNIFISKDELNNFRRTYHNTNVYSTVLSYDSRNQREANKYGPLYCDFDGDFEQVRQDAIKVAAFFKAVLHIPYDEMLWFFSGCKGLHLLIPPNIFQLEPRADLNQVYKRIMADIAKTLWKKDTILQHTLDLRIYDIRRLFRLPNSRHGKTGLFKIPLAWEEVQYFSQEAIIELAQAPRLVRVKPGEPNQVAKMYLQSFFHVPALERSLTIKRLSIMPSCIQWILNNPQPEGSRNSACILAASALYQIGKSQDEIMERMMEWGSRCRPPMEQAVISSIVRRAQFYSYGCNSVKSIAPCDNGCPFWGRDGDKYRGFYARI